MDEKYNVTKSLSRKANYSDNAATEQVFGHMKELFPARHMWCAIEF